MTPGELHTAQRPSAFANLVMWTAIALVVVGFVVSRWWLYGWILDHAPRWVAIWVMGG